MKMQIHNPTVCVCACACACACASLKRRASVINPETKERAIVYTAGCKPAAGGSPFGVTGYGAVGAQGVAPLAAPQPPGNTATLPIGVQTTLRQLYLKELRRYEAAVSAASAAGSAHISSKDAETEKEKPAEKSQVDLRFRL